MRCEARSTSSGFWNFCRHAGASQKIGNVDGFQKLDTGAYCVRQSEPGMRGFRWVKSVRRIRYLTHADPYAGP
jgi:hypothetical protein